MHPANRRSMSKLKDQNALRNLAFVGTSTNWMKGRKDARDDLASFCSHRFEQRPQSQSFEGPQFKDTMHPS